VDAPPGEFRRDAFAPATGEAMAVQPVKSHERSQHYEGQGCQDERLEVVKPAEEMDGFQGGGLSGRGGLMSEAAIMTSRLIVAQVFRLGISEKLEGNM